MLEQIKQYKKAKLKLIHMNGRTKEPAVMDWPNNKTKYKHWSNGGVEDNVGLAHNMNNTVCFDLDDVAKVCELYPEIGRLVEDKFCGARYTSGKPNRMKILFTLPPELSDGKFSMITLASGCGQIRGGSSGLQDLLPPSVHPENPSWVYTWESSFNGTIPTLPKWLKKVLIAVIESSATARARGKLPAGMGKAPYPFVTVYNQWFMEQVQLGEVSLMDSIMELGGYEIAGINTLKRIGSTNKQAVVIYHDSDGVDRAYNFSDTKIADNSVVTNGALLLDFGLNDPYAVLSCNLGFDAARKYVCKENIELKERVDEYENRGLDEVTINVVDMDKPSADTNSSDSGSRDDNSAPPKIIETGSTVTHKYTKYPEQIGAMGKLVTSFMKMHPFATPEIAVVQAHSLVSTLGGRVYTFEQGTGIVWTALVVGRTGRGKSFILSHITQVISELSYGKLGKMVAVGAAAPEEGGNNLSTYTPIAGAYYTSIKNFVDDIKGNGSILSVRTESGQMDKSKAGDMARVRMLELELSTKSGSRGFIAKGGQNDKIPAMFSPACTVIRETVLESTLDVDLEKNVDIAGETGRRSHVVINPIKPLLNRDTCIDFPCGHKLQARLVRLFGMACRESTRDVSSRLSEDQWITIGFDHGVEDYYHELSDKWVALENQCVDSGDRAGIAFISRLVEKVPAWAGRLAIMEDVDEPIITRAMIDCAVASLNAEHTVFADVKADIRDNWEVVCEKVLEIFNNTNPKKYLAIYRGYGKSRPRNYEAMKEALVIEWPKVRSIISKIPAFRAISNIPNVDFVLFQRLKNYNIYEVDKRTAKKLWQSPSICVQLRE